MAGIAGEYAVAAQLILRGVDVYFPGVDWGVDLMTGSGCRVQVKSAHINTSPAMIAAHGEGTYNFSLHVSRRVVRGGGTSEIIRRPKPSARADVYVFWGIDQNRFWVVPASIADDVTCFNLGREITPRFVGNIADVHEMVKLGYTHAEIGKKYGVNRTLITQILNRPGFESQGPSATAQARACEGAWHHIIDFRREDHLELETERKAQQETK